MAQRRNKETKGKTKSQESSNPIVDISQLLDQAFRDENPREALSTLSALAKKKSGKKDINSAEDSIGRSAFYGLLAHADPKVRKNAAILLGALADSRDIPALEAAHQSEEFGYVRASLLLALGSLPGTASYLSSVILHEETAHPDEKHALSLVLSRLATLRHPFVSLPGVMDVLLLTVPGFEDDLVEHAVSLGLDARAENAGEVTVLTADYPGLFRLRAFSEALFPIARGIDLDAHVVARAVFEQGIPALIGQMHGASGPFGFRVEIRDLDHTVRGKLAAATANALSAAPELVNSPSNYDIEFRIVPAQEGKCDLFFKLYSFEDTRFGYRKADVPASIAPATAAAIMLRCQGRMDAAHEVLDPFCGSGTLLFERLSIMPARKVYGVDIDKHAVSAAKENAVGMFSAAFIHMDSLDFKPRHPLGEIYANMPFGHRSLSHAQNLRLYKSFLELLPGWLAEDGFAALLTMEKRLVRDLADSIKGLRIVNEHPVSSGKLLPSLFIITKQ